MYTIPATTQSIETFIGAASMIVYWLLNSSWIMKNKKGYQKTHIISIETDKTI